MFTPSRLRGCLAALMLATPAFAQTVLDPTRPMASLLAETLDPRVSGKPVVRAATAASAPAVPAVRRLQSVRLSEQGHATALLDGHVVQLGDRVGELIVVSIDKSGLTLRGPRG